MLHDIAVILPSRTRYLPAKVRVVDLGDGGLQFALGRWTNSTQTQAISDTIQHSKDDGPGWIKEIVATLEPPLEPGWHQFELHIDGSGHVDGFMLHAESDR